MSIEERDTLIAEVREAAREAVREELRSSNIIDGPTHIKHHEFLAGIMDNWYCAKRSVISTLAKLITVGLIGAVAAYMTLKGMQGK